MAEYRITPSTVDDLQCGDYIAVLFNNDEEQKAFLQSYLLASQKHACKFIYLYNDDNIDKIKHWINAVDINTSHLQINQIPDYLNEPDGVSFENIKLIIEKIENEELEQGYAGVFIIIDSNWLLTHDYEVEYLVDIQHKLINWLKKHKVRLATQFDQKIFPMKYLFPIISSHPLIAAGSEVHISPQSITSQTEQALRDSEEQFRTLVQNVIGAVYRCELEKPWRIYYMNDGVYRLTGFTASRFLQHELNWADICHPDDLDELSRIINESVQNNQPYEVEYRIIHADGSIRWVHETGRAISSDYGNPLFLDGVIVDVSERYQMQQELKDASALSHSLVSNSPIGIYFYELNPNNQLILKNANPAADKIIGINHQDLIGFTIEQAFPGLTNTDIPEAYRQVAKTGVNWSAAEVIYSDNCISGAYEVHATQTTPNNLAVAFTDITQRSITEEALRQSENKYRALVESALNIIMQIDVDGRITFMNDFALNFFGYKEEEITGQRVVGKIVPDLEEIEQELQDYINILRTSPETIGYNEVENTTNNGRRVRIVWTIKAMLDQSGELYGLLCVGSDVTEERNATRVNAQRMQALLDLNQMADVSLDEITSFTLERVVELTRSEIGYLAFVNDDETILTMHAWSQSAMEECQITDQKREYRLDETGLWGEAVRQRRPIITNDYQAPNPWKKGYPVGHVEITRHMNTPVIVDSKVVLVAGVANKRDEDYNEIDMQQLNLLMEGMWRLIERKRTLEELHNSQALYRTFVDAHSDFVFLKDEQLRFLLVNRVYADYLGHNENEIIGANDFDLMPPNVARLNQQSDLNAIEQNDIIISYDMNSDCVFEARKFPVPLPGDKLGVGGYIRDVTELRRAEDSERLATVGQLASGVAHEFNNLLASMLLLADRALLVNTPEAYQKLAQLVRKQSIRGGDLCHALTAFAKPREPHKAPLQIASVIKNALEIINPQLQTGDIQVVIQDETRGALAFADSDQLEQVFVNLFINACHAMPEGGELRILSTVEKNTSGEAQIVVQVIDNGVGILPKHLNRIFEPFFTTKGRLGESDIPGTGLGLAVSHGIISAHEGQLLARSIIGCGTTLEIHLPVCNTISADLLSVPVASSLTEHFEFSGNVLLVEDEEDLRNLIASVLHDAGLSVDTATDAAFAEEMLNNNQYTLVITDLLMPGGGGQAVMQYIQSLPSAPPIIIITGQIESHARNQAMNFGAQALLVKPFSTEQLLNALKAVIINNLNNSIE